MIVKKYHFGTLDAVFQLMLILMDESISLARDGDARWKSWTAFFSVIHD
jgi:hypothetical protein